MTTTLAIEDAEAAKEGHRFLAIAWFNNGCYAYGGSDNRDQALARCRRAVRRDFAVKGSFKANVYDTGGEIVSFDRYCNVWDASGRSITEDGEIVQVF